MLYLILRKQQTAEKITDTIAVTVAAVLRKLKICDIDAAVFASFISFIQFPPLSRTAWATPGIVSPSKVVV